MSEFGTFFTTPLSFCVCGVSLVLEEECYEDMLTKFGRQVDLEALQTLSGNRKLEELRQCKLLKDADQDKEIKEWDVRVPHKDKRKSRENNGIIEEF